MNLALYMVFTIVCYYAAYPPDFLCRQYNASVVDSAIGARLPTMLRRFITMTKMPKDQVVAVCLCGAAKTQALGIPLADAMWAQSPELTRSLIQIPILLYTMEQVFTAQFLTILFRWWLQRDRARVADEEAEAVGDAGEVCTGQGIVARTQVDKNTAKSGTQSCATSRGAKVVA